MDNKTESYIILKPIAERFSRVANSISDDEIKSLIKDELRGQLKKIDLGILVNEICETWVEDNQDTITDLLKKSMVEKFK